MSGSRILALIGAGLAVAGLLLGPPLAVAPAALVVVLAAGLVLWASVRGRNGARRDAESAVRTAFGPALDALETLAVFTVDEAGRVAYVNRGAVRLYGRSDRELVGRPAGASVYSEAEDPDLAESLREVFRTGRPAPPRRLLLFTGGGPRAEAVVLLAPVVRYGKVVEVAVLRADTRGAGATTDKHERLLEAAPAGLLGVDASGRIDAVNRRLADLLGRRADALEGTDVARTEALPDDLRALLAAHAARSATATPLPAGEADVVLVTAAGASRTFHVHVAARAGGGADAVFVDGASRRRLLTELEAARQALVETREATADAIATTTQDLKERVARVVEAARRTADEASGPIERRSASAELRLSTEQLLESVQGGADRALLPSPFARDGKPSVLLVEDNEENRELLAHMLRSRGADVVAVGTGRQALDAAARHGFRFVLLDLQMPEMDGFQVLRRLRALPGGDRLPVVALTALTSDLVKERCEAEGMDDFVSKPVTLARVGELVRKWSRAREA